MHHLRFVLALILSIIYLHSDIVEAIISQDDGQFSPSTPSPTVISCASIAALKPYKWREDIPCGGLVSNRDGGFKPRSKPIYFGVLEEATNMLWAFDLYTEQQSNISAADAMYQELVDSDAIYHDLALLTDNIHRSKNITRDMKLPACTTRRQLNEILKWLERLTIQISRLNAECFVRDGSNHDGTLYRLDRQLRYFHCSFGAELCSRTDMCSREVWSDWLTYEIPASPRAPDNNSSSCKVFVHALKNYVLPRFEEIVYIISDGAKLPVIEQSIYRDGPKMTDESWPITTNARNSCKYPRMLSSTDLVTQPCSAECGLYSDAETTRRAVMNAIDISYRSISSFPHLHPVDMRFIDERFPVFDNLTKYYNSSGVLRTHARYLSFVITQMVAKHIPSAPLTHNLIDLLLVYDKILCRNSPGDDKLPVPVVEHNLDASTSNLSRFAYVILRDIRNFWLDNAGN